MPNDYNTYYKALMKNFGGANLIGAQYIAEILVLMDDKTNTCRELENYKQIVAERNETNAPAVDRAIRNYIKMVQEKYTIQELSVMLDYTFRVNQEKISVSEFLSVLKYNIDINE